MIRQTVRSLALLAAGLMLAGVAFGQAPVLRQAASATQLVAAEYFGSTNGREIQTSAFDLDSDSTNGVQRPYVSLGVGSAAIAANNQADITFTLGGATFSQTVSPTALDLRTDANCATVGGNAPTTSVQSGGARGDSAVTFRVVANGSLDSGQFLCFWVPNLQATLTTVSAPTVMPPQLGVSVTATIAAVSGASSPFPGRISGPVAGDVDANNDNDALDGAEVGSSPNPGSVLFRAERVLVTSLGTGGTAMVALADRTKIIAIGGGGTPDPSAANPRSAATGLSLGTLSIEVSADATSGMIKQLDGMNAVTAGEIDSSLGGQVMVSVSGPFQSGDKVVFGAGSEAQQIAPADGMASRSLQLEVGMTSIVYVPGGTEILRPATFTTTAKYSFNNLNNNSNLAIMATTGQITYAGINIEGYAYGVVRGGGVDRSIIRVTCEAGSGMCQIFGDCTDQSGMNYFGGPVPVGAGETAVWTSEQLAAVIDGGWESGRARCDIWSTHPLAVQHMVRAGHVLINNSTVVGRGLDERTDSGTGTSVANVKSVVDDICDSVAGIADLDTTTDGNQSTPCLNTAN